MVAQAFRGCAAGVKFGTEPGGNPGSVGMGGRPVGGQRGEVAGDCRKRKPEALGDHGEGQAAQVGAGIAAVPAGIGNGVTSPWVS